MNEQHVIFNRLYLHLIAVERPRENLVSQNNYKQFIHQSLFYEDGSSVREDSGSQTGGHQGGPHRNSGTLYIIVLKLIN